MRVPILALAFFATLAPSLLRAQDRTTVAAPVRVASPVAVEESDESAATIQSAIGILNDLVAETPPGGLSRPERAAYDRHTAWLLDVRDRLEAHVGLRNQVSGSGMVAEMTRMNQEFLELQQAVQSESRKYQTLSNASKARHDVAMNAIRNMKG
jgi:hypothetical protein